MHICLDDCRQSSASVHVHHLRNEQCACTYDLNKKMATRWCASLIRSRTRQPIKLLVESLKMKRGSSAGGLMVGHLAWKARDAGLSPAQHYTFHLQNSL